MKKNQTNDRLVVKSIVAKELQTSSTFDGPRVRFTVDASSQLLREQYVLLVVEMGFRRLDLPRWFGQEGRMGRQWWAMRKERCVWHFVLLAMRMLLVDLQLHLLTSIFGEEEVAE